MSTLTRKALGGVIGMVLTVAVLVFGGSWTFDYWQAWLFLAVYFACALALTLYIARKDPKLLERRMRGGPLAEKEPAQRIIMLIASAGFTGSIVVPALDRRFGWSDMPPWVAIGGDILTIVSWLAIYTVFRENSFTSATIELAPDQRVVSTGPYALVRHPMYAGALPMLLGIPIALGSWWGVLAVLVIMPALIWRIFDEEQFLGAHLAGYTAYMQKVRYRLIPHLW
jgi:protein-S-isoprenylcysteine O-methyltransferase Ste14